MWTSLIAALLATGPVAATGTPTTARTDTSFKVREGTRFHVENFGGGIEVASWSKNTVRIEATHSPRIRVFVEESGSNIKVNATSRRGIPGRVDYRIQVPGWMPIELSGVYTDMTIEGMKSEVKAETVKGDVRLKGGEGFIKLASVQGTVLVEGARGRLELSSVNESVVVTDVEGDVSVEAVNGDVLLERIRTRRIDAATVNGDVRFVGEVTSGGRYRFATHTGDVDVAIPESADATVNIATFNGDFESEFQMLLDQPKKDKRFTFHLGSGSALLDLETFQGTIHLRRAHKEK